MAAVTPTRTKNSPLHYREVNWGKLEAQALAGKQAVEAMVLTPEIINDTPALAADLQEQERWMPLGPFQPSVGAPANGSNVEVRSTSPLELTK